MVLRGEELGFRAGNVGCKFCQWSWYVRSYMDADELGSDDDDEITIPLPNVEIDVLSKVVEWMQYHVTEVLSFRCQPIFIFYARFGRIGMSWWSYMFCRALLEPIFLFLFLLLLFIIIDDTDTMKASKWNRATAKNSSWRFNMRMGPKLFGSRTNNAFQTYFGETYLSILLRLGFFKRRK